MAEPSKVEQAAEWAAEEYERRTRLIGAGEKVSFYWISPNQRVDWHEICNHFDMQVMGPTDRIEFQSLFERAMRRRHLLQVLRGKMKSDEWLEKYG